jgi:membrane dipeptidase
MIEETASVPVPDLRTRALALHRSLPVVADLHSHALLGIGYMGWELDRPRPPFRRWNPLRNLCDLVDLPRAREGGVTLLVFTVYVLPAIERRYFRRTLRMIERYRRYLDKHREIAAHAASAAEVERARAEGKIACMLAVEGGHSIDGRLENLERLREEGVVYLTLTHFLDNALSASATHAGLLRRNCGLTRLGKEAVREMNRLSILADVTHCSQRARRETAAISRQPLIFSHVGLRRFVDVRRMATDDELRMVRDSGGLCGLLLSPYFLNGTRTGGADAIAENLLHMIDVMGEDHVAIGSDFDSGLPPPTGFRDMRDFPEITVELLRRGLPERAIAKAWGGSFLRLLRAIGR